MDTSYIYAIADRYKLGYLAYILIIIGLFLITLSTAVPPSFIYIPIFCAWLPLVGEAIKQLRQKKIGTEFFLVFATFFAVIGGQQHAIMIVLLIMIIARYATLLIENRTQSALGGLMRLIPSTVTVVADHQEQQMPLHDVVPGMQILVKTGGRIPVDGIVSDGTATVNEAPLTGESAPQEKSKGHKVFAGTFIEAGSIVVITEKIREETLFGKMTALLAQAEQKKARLTQFTDKITLIFTPVLLIFIAIMWFITRDFNLVITLLIFGSPLELSLVTPLAVLSATIAAMRHGILIKSGLALERLAHADTIIFDKTGTLTIGEPRIVHIQLFTPAITEREFITLAAVAEKRSAHAVAKAILHKAQEEQIKVPDPDTYMSLEGHGVSMTFKGNRYMLGNQHFIEAPEHGHSPIPGLLNPAADEAIHSTFYLVQNNTVLGALCITDTIRPEALQTIKELKQMGITNMILVSGDRQEVTTLIAQKLGVDKAYGGVFPEDKLTFLEKLQNSGHTVAMIGDGINDAPALKQADVGIAMGAMGMEPAIDAADIVLMTNNLHNILFTRALAQKMLRIIYQNLILGFTIVHTLGIVLTLARLVSPIQAALFHGFTDVIILINAGRLINFDLAKQPDAPQDAVQ